MQIVGVDVARFGDDSTVTFVRHDAMQTFAEVMQSDLVKEYGVERALWIIVNAHGKCSELLEFRKKRIEELEARLANANPGTTESP